MTKATFYQNRDGEFTGFQVYDHSGAGEQGSDVVCAAISALVINTINSIDELTDDEFSCESDEDNASISLSIQPEHSGTTDVLIRSLIIGLTNLEEDEDSRDYIDVIFEEV